MPSREATDQIMSALVAKSEQRAQQREASARSQAKAIKPYDFRRPDKFSKEHFRSLRLIHDSFARLLGSSFSSYLRTSVQIHCATIDEVTYGDYIQSLVSPTVVYIVTLDPLPGQAVIQLDMPVAQAMVDRLLGGKGIPDPRVHDMTEIEMRLLKSLGGFFGSSLRDAWANMLPLEPETSEPVFSPEFVQITLPSEATARLVFEANLVKTVGTMSICLPHPVLQPILETLTSRLSNQRAKEAEEDNDELGPIEQLRRVSVPIIAELGHARLPLREILDLAPGQILKLDTPADGDLTIRIGGVPKLAGRPGTVSKSNAVRVTRTLS
ncbi:MAG: flagellar motor switch protein FliM [Chloroflexota bacterium]|jgi:flagellar motor switch protein FliM|nr:flagellar motor switch protein FliM [Chloroflexota bacterium]